MLAKALINEINDQGKGRAFVVIYESEEYRKFAETLFNDISQTTRCLLIKSEIISDRNWMEISTAFQEYLSAKSLRQASFISFGAASAIVLNLALADLKQVRSLVLVDACTRPHPSALQKIVDKIEGILPLGLPLRSNSSGFDAKSFLQRLRCPILIVTSDTASAYIKSQAETFKLGLPTAWAISLHGSRETHDLKDLVMDFQKVPAKCPQ